jgi:uncharacterized SAM-binding protein YcdF (DUF218 family)
MDLTPADAPAKILYDYLALATPSPEPVDAIIGFGHFDLSIPRQCGALYRQGLAPRLIFTGGLGGGTADLGRPEALAFAEELHRQQPDFPAAALILESESTNTSENIQFTVQKLARDYPALAFGAGIRRAILVASAYRQRRVWLTCRKNLPQVDFCNAPPPTTFEWEEAMFAAKGFDFVALLVGEIDRLIEYGQRGYLLAEPVPDEVYRGWVGLKTENKGQL